MAKRSLSILLVIWLAGAALGNYSSADDPATAEALYLKSQELSDAGRFEEALSPAQESLRILESLLGPEDPRVGATLNNLAIIYELLGEFQKTMPLYQRALKIAEKFFGPEHPNTITSLNNLARIYYDTHAYNQALPLYQRVLEIREKVSGPEHLDTASSLNNLARLYKAVGNYQQALPLLQRVLEIREKILGPKHLETGTSLNNLAVIYRSMGAYNQALTLSRRALEITETVLGPEHPNTATGLNNLAGLYKAMGVYDQAMPLQKKALEIDEKVLGPQHPQTAASLNNLALLYISMGTYDKALPLLQQVLEIREKVLGPEHPDTAGSLNNLGGLYEAMGDYGQALPLHQRALKINEKVLGPEHLNTSYSLNNLAELYRAMGAYDQALPLQQRTLKIREKVLGPQHPETAISLNNLALLYLAVGNYDQALPLHQRVLQIKEIALGTEHPGIATSLNNLAELYVSMGDYDQALPLYKRALSIVEKGLGSEHPDTAGSLDNIAGLYGAMGIYDQALQLHKRAIEIREKVLGPQHPETATSLNNIAGIYQYMGSYDQALPLLQQALKIKEKSLGAYHPSTATSLNNLALLYHDMGNYEQALPLSQRALQIAEKALGPEHPDTAGSLSTLAGHYISIGAYDRALSLQQRALEIRKKVLGAEHPDTANSFLNIGFIYLSRGDWQRAEKSFIKSNSTGGMVELYLATGQEKEALTMLQEMAPSWRSSPRYQAQYFTEKGLALFGVGRLQEAAISLSQAIQVTEILRGKVTGERAGFLQTGRYGGNIRPYQSLVVVLIQMAFQSKDLPKELKQYGPDPGAAAFYFAESTKARSLLEAMSQEGLRHFDPQIPSDLAKREQGLRDRLGALEGQWEKHYTRGEEAVKHFRQQRETLQAELDQLVAELRKEYPRYAVLKYPQPLKPQEIPLQKGEVLLEYALGDKNCYLFRVEPGGKTRVFKLPLGKEELEKRLTPLLAPFRQEKIELSDLKKFSPDELARLYQELLGPALKDVAPGAHLILIPDGVLGAFPLEALVVQAGKDWDDSILVADRWPVTYAQSAALLALNRLLPKSRAELPLFAVGDCIYDKNSSRYLAYKEGKGKAGELQEPGRELALTMSSTHITWEKKVFSPLPETRKTVAELAALFNQPIRPPQVLLDVLATETRVRQTPLERYRYLFFGTHGDLTDKTQGFLQPVLILTQVENQPDHDGNLTFTEVLNLKLDADLVTLAACRTGEGQAMQGEGLLHMARAFQQAGARSVMVALWNITVKESLQFYQTFYQALQAGKTRLNALKEARETVRQQKPHPYFWAGLSLHGEGG